jgi:tetratricopeptide (TPR) repeat protein
MIRFERMHLFRLFVPLILLSFFYFPSLADELPPDQEAAELQAHLVNEPGDALGWIRLADLQRLMGYGHQARASFAEAAAIIKKLPKEEKRKMAGPYYTAKAWLEYDTTNWDVALANARRAYKIDPCSETKLVSILSRYAAQGEGKIGDPVRGEEGDPWSRHFEPRTESGPRNHHRNFYWVVLMFRHYHRVAFSEFSWATVGDDIPDYRWRDMFCRRDYGYVFESNGYWDAAGEFYEFSVDWSPVGRGNWVVAHERLTPLQTSTDTPMPFWTNADGGYVTGSLMAYTEWATEQMLNAPSQESRRRWAVMSGDGASRCLAVYPNPSWPWLWRALAWQVQGEATRATSDLSQAKAEFAETGADDPKYDYAKGHELILREKYSGALPWLEKAVAELPDLAACWSDLGLARVMTGDRQGALEAFDRTLELAPDWAVALHNRGVLHLQEGRNKAALEDLTRAAELAPEDPQVVTDLQRAIAAAQ